MPLLRLHRARTPLHLALPLALGIGCLVAAALSAQPTIDFLGRATTVEATHVGIPKNGFAGFRYRTPDGAITRVAMRTNILTQTYADGETVRLLYDPLQPGYARLDTIASLWFKPLVLGTTGLSLSILGIVLLARARRKG